MPICEICSEVVDRVYTCEICGRFFCTLCGDSEEKICGDCLGDDEDKEETEDDWEDEEDLDSWYKSRSIYDSHAY